MVSLYRVYDAEDTLLYVGVSEHPLRRFDAHARDKEWFSSATTVTVEHFPDRAAALAAERIAICQERPRHNVQHRTYSSMDEKAVREIATELLELTGLHLEGVSPLDALAQLTDAIEGLERARDRHAAAALAEGESYAEVARATHLSRQGARKRYGHLEVVS